MIYSLIYFLRGAAAPAEMGTIPNYTKCWEYMYVHLLSMLLQFVSIVRYIASFWNWSASKSKIGPHFDMFDPPPCKNWEGVSEMFESEQSWIVVTQVLGFR